MTAPLLDRALLLADRLIRTAESLGWPLQDSPSPQPKKLEPRRLGWQPPIPTPKPTLVIARLLVDGVEVEIQIDERMRKVRLDTASPSKKSNQYDRSPSPYRIEATGVLRLACPSPHFYDDLQHRIWYDQGRSRIEDKISTILRRAEDRIHGSAASN